MGPVVTLVGRQGRMETHHMEQGTSLNSKRASTREGQSRWLLNKDRRSQRVFDFKQTFLGHQSVNHPKKEYVHGRGEGTVNCNIAESLHALLKHSVMATHHDWSKKHLHRYLSEFDFRWNHRKVVDGERTLEAIKGIEEKRLMYRDSSRVSKRH